MKNITEDMIKIDFLSELQFLERGLENNEYGDEDEKEKPEVNKTLSKKLKIINHHVNSALEDFENKTEKLNELLSSNDIDKKENVNIIYIERLEKYLSAFIMKSVLTKKKIEAIAFKDNLLNKAISVAKQSEDSKNKMKEDTKNKTTKDTTSNMDKFYSMTDEYNGVLKKFLVSEKLVSRNDLIKYCIKKEASFETTVKKYGEVLNKFANTFKFDKASGDNLKKLTSILDENVAFMQDIIELHEKAMKINRKKAGLK